MSLTSATAATATPQRRRKTTTPADNRPRHMGSLLDGVALGSSKYSTSYVLVQRTFNVIERLFDCQSTSMPSHGSVCSTSVQAKALKAFDTWHRAFHGTKEEYVKPILTVGQLLVPGNSFNYELIWIHKL